MFIKKEDRPKIGTPEWVALKQERNQKVAELCDQILQDFQNGNVIWDVKSSVGPSGGLLYEAITVYRDHKLFLDCTESNEPPFGYDVTLRFCDRDRHAFRNISLSLQQLGKEIIETGGDARDIETVLNDLLCY